MKTRSFKHRGDAEKRLRRYRMHRLIDCFTRPNSLLDDLVFVRKLELTPFVPGATSLLPRRQTMLMALSKEYA